MVNSDARINGDTAVLSPQPAAKKPIECIDLDDEDEVILLEEPPAKRPKQQSRESSSVPATVSHASPSQPSESTSNTAKKPDDKQLTDYTALLDRLQEHVENVMKIGTAVDRKLLDTLLGAINVQVQKEPYSVRKLILDKQLVLPNSISFPPSQVVDAVIEHDADMQISKVLNRMFGADRVKLSDAEKRERQHFKSSFPAPAMTRSLMEVGQDLVQETTYSDIVHARNLPEMPKNVETYKQVAAQLKPVWEHLRDKNTSFKLKTYTCSVCGFKTENLLLMSEHKQTLHIGENKKIQCGMCPEYNTSGTRMHRHYIEKHGLVPLIPEEPPSKVQCPLCEQDFPFKGQRDTHMKTCKREVTRLMSIQASRMPEHSAMINRWLWTRPPADPIMQQNIRRQQTDETPQQQRPAGQTPRTTPASASSVVSRPSIVKAQPTPAPKATPPAATSNVGAMFASQQFQNQLKNLGPAQQKQLEQLLQSKQSQIPPNVLNAIQAQLRNIQQSQQVQQASTPLAKNLAQMSQLNSLASKLNPQMLQQLTRTMQQQHQQQQSSSSTPNRGSPAVSQRKNPQGATSQMSRQSFPASMAREDLVCEICDDKLADKRNYLAHLQNSHSVLRGRNATDLDSGPPLACSRCRDRFWSYDGLERHLVMKHSLVTSDLLQKAQNKQDAGRCLQCRKTFAFNILQHLASDHGAKLCSAEIMFSCDVCTFKCSSYAKLEVHLNESHPKNGAGSSKNGIH